MFKADCKNVSIFRFSLMNFYYMEKRFEEILKEGIGKTLFERGIKDFDKASCIPLGKALTEFYLKEIGQYLIPVYEEDIDDNICDGKGDLGIDFIYKRENSWLIFQSKYKGQSSNLTSGEAADFFQIFPRIANQDYLNAEQSQIV